MMQTAAYPGMASKIPHEPEKFFRYRIPATGKRFPEALNAIAVQKLEIRTRQTNVDESIAAFWDYQFLFISQRLESREPVTLRTVQGAVPPDFPSGTYYLVGPGLFSDDHGSTLNPLDCHGYLRAFTVEGNSGEVRFSARYVETEAQREEHDRSTGKWRFTHPGLFSVLKEGRKILNRKLMRNVANTSVLQWGHRLLCLWEGGEPYEVELGTLETVGLFDFSRGSLPEPRFSGGGTYVSSPELENCGGKLDGVLPDEDLPESGERWPRFGSFRPKSIVIDLIAGFLRPILHGVFKMPAKRFLAHYKIDPRLNRLLMIACNAEDVLLPCSHFTIYELDRGFNLLHKQEFIIPDHLMIHDWAFTENHYILVGNRIKLEVAGTVSAVCGLKPIISAVSTNRSSKTSPIYLLPRFPGNLTGNWDWRVPVEAPSQLWLLHAGNAFEERNEDGNLNIQIHASVCSYEWINFHKLLGYKWENHKLDPSYMNAEGSPGFLTHLVQISMELNPNGHCNRCTVEPLNQWTHVSDFPVINPGFWGRKNKYIYSGTSLGSRQSLPHFPFDTVAKLNLSSGSIATWSVGKREFIGEPIFVPRGVGVGEDEGYILVVEYAVSIQRCYLVILDSQRIGEADALVAKLEVPKHLNFPMGFHGFWADSNL